MKCSTDGRKKRYQWFKDGDGVLCVDTSRGHLVTTMNGNVQIDMWMHPATFNGKQTQIWSRNLPYMNRIRKPKK